MDLCNAIYIIFFGFFGCIIQNTYCTTASTDSDKRIECFACGLPMIDPTKDNSTFSLDPYEPKSKIYNESCTIYKQYQLEYPEYMNKWVRKCPAGSTNCFWAKGTLNAEDPEFRGCAQVKFQHEHKCTKEIQAVTVVDNQKHVDVEVELCYCPEDKCNEERNIGQNNRFNYIIMLMTIIVTLVFGVDK